MQSSLISFYVVYLGHFNILFPSTVSPFSISRSPVSPTPLFSSSYFSSPLSSYLIFLHSTLHSPFSSSLFFLSLLRSFLSLFISSFSPQTLYFPLFSSLFLFPIPPSPTSHHSPVVFPLSSPSPVSPLASPHLTTVLSQLPSRLPLPTPNLPSPIAPFPTPLHHLPTPTHPSPISHFPPHLPHRPFPTSPLPPTTLSRSSYCRCPCIMFFS